MYLDVDKPSQYVLEMISSQKVFGEFYHQDVDAWIKKTNLVF